MWLALELSNRVKRNPRAAKIYKNRHIHPMQPFNIYLHVQQYHPEELTNLQHGENGNR
jgi:hypothetical protein